MRKYKGWEIVKMLDEKVLKVGEELTVTYGSITKELVVVANALEGALYLKEKDIDNSAPSSYFASNTVFRRKLKPLTFFEAMAKADEGKKVTNDNLKDENGNYTGCYLKKGNKLHYYVLSNNAGGVFGISEDEMISHWYVYEE